MYADEDVLAFAILFEAELLPHAFYSAGQALEKYLKAIALERLAQGGKDATFKTNAGWLTEHPLVALAKRCEDSVDVYTDRDTRKTLKRFSKFDLTARYPMLEWRFSTEDLPVFENLLHQIRGRLPLNGVRTILAKALQDTAGVSTQVFLEPFTKRILTDLTTRTWAAGGLAARRVFAEPDALLVEGEEASRAS